MMHPKKLENILKLPYEDRYWYSIREIVKLETVWAVSAGEGDWVSYTDENGDSIFLIWPHEKAAEICIPPFLKEFTVKPILLENFISATIPDMESQGIYFGVFMNQESEVFCVSARRLSKDLEEEELGDYPSV